MCMMLVKDFKGPEVLKYLKEFNYIKDIKDIIDNHMHLETRRPFPPDPPPWDRRFERGLVELASHVGAIEEFLESGDLTAGKAFVRPQERPSVGDEALSQGLQAIEQRLQRIESSLAERGSVRQGAKG